MDPLSRIEKALNAAIAEAETPTSPPRLAAAMRHAVFPRGARIRPRLCLAVAAACADDLPTLTDAAAAAIELLPLRLPRPRRPPLLRQRRHPPRPPHHPLRLR